MNIITMPMIESVFTAKVRELLAQNMHISFVDKGTQGEISKCDLTDDKFLYRVLCLRSYIDDVTTISIQVRKYINPTGTLWNHEGEIIFIKKYYEINDYIYTADKDNLREIKRKQSQRYRNRITPNRTKLRLDRNLADKVVKIMTTKTGYKSLKIRDIKAVNKITDNNKLYAYEITFRNRKNEYYIK